jgi:hypothetical protein
MRTYDQLLQGILDQLPTPTEVERLTEKQVATLRGACNALDNILYLQGTPTGRAYVREQASRPARPPEVHGRKG